MPINAQKSYHLQLHALDKDSLFIKEKLDYTTIHSDSLSVLLELRQILNQLQQKAYWEASVDGWLIQDSLYQVWLHIGKSYQWAKLKNGNVEQSFLNQVGFRERLYENKVFDYKKVLELQEALLQYAENNGYPFAKVCLDSIQIQEGIVTAQLMMEKNQLVFIKDIQIEGTANISEVYLMNYLGLKKGTPFSREKVAKIKNRIKELPFLKESKDALVVFEADQATIKLFLEKKKASQFDFVVGFLPTTSTVNNESVRRFLITGSFKGEIQNPFGFGERIYAEFERLRPETQQLGLEFSYPFILDLPFGVHASINQYKRDTTNNNVAIDFGLQYLLEGNNYIKIFWNNTTSNLLAIDTAQILRQAMLPNNLDIKNNAFGLEYAMQQVDYRFNPRKGWSMLLRASAGVKNISKNSKILELSNEETDFNALYDSLGTSIFQYKIDSKVAVYIPLFKLFTFQLSNQTGVILAKEKILQNEQYRIGGNRLLRGFDEEAIFASIYSVFTAEYRLLIGQNSYTYIFGDYGYVKDEFKTDKSNDFPLGFGLGINFETNVGIFGVNLAFGRRLANPIDFSTPKVHFGYISLF